MYLRTVEVLCAVESPPRSCMCPLLIQRTMVKTVLMYIRFCIKSQEPTAFAVGSSERQLFRIQTTQLPKSVWGSTGLNALKRSPFMTVRYRLLVRLRTSRPRASKPSLVPAKASALSGFRAGWNCSRSLRSPLIWATSFRVLVSSNPTRQMRVGMR